MTRAGPLHRRAALTRVAMSRIRLIRALTAPFRLACGARVALVALACAESGPLECNLDSHHPISQPLHTPCGAAPPQERPGRMERHGGMERAGAGVEGGWLSYRTSRPG